LQPDTQAEETFVDSFLDHSAQRNPRRKPRTSIAYFLAKSK
jgi:hypothetical protein